MRLLNRHSLVFKWLISFLSGVLLFSLSFWWLSASYTYGDEENVVKWTSGLKRILLGKNIYPEEFLFVDISHEKMLVPSISGAGCDVITDRSQLAKFFRKVDRLPGAYKMILCDVLLQDTTIYDQDLKKSIAGLDRVVFPNDLDNKGKPGRLAIDVASGIANYTDHGSGYFKFSLFQAHNSLTLPVLMYQTVTGRKIVDQGIFHFDDTGLCFNTLITDQRIRQFQLSDSGDYTVHRLTDLVEKDSVTLNQQYIKNRIVLIGDFEGDMHDTVFGSTAGTVVLLNIYLALTEGRHIITIWWVVFMLVCFTVLSKMILFYHTPYKRRKINWMGPLIKSTVFLLVMSGFSYFVFDRHVQVLVTVIYINILHYLILLSKKPLSWINVKKAYKKVKQMEI